MDQTYRVLVSRNSSRLHHGFAEFEFLTHEWIRERAEPGVPRKRPSKLVVGWAFEAASAYMSIPHLVCYVRGAFESAAISFGAAHEGSKRHRPDSSKLARPISVAVARAYFLSEILTRVVDALLSFSRTAASSSGVHGNYFLKAGSAYRSLQLQIPEFLARRITMRCQT